MSECEGVRQRGWVTYIGVGFNTCTTCDWWFVPPSSSAADVLLTVINITLNNH